MFSNKDQHLIDRILKASLKLAQMKGHNTFETFQKMNDKCRPHKLLTNMFKIDSWELDGRNIFTLSPKEKGSGKHILFLHGGAYVTNMTPGHWFFVGALIQKMNCSVIIPDYPLVPDHDVKDVFDFILPVYKDIIADIDPDHLTIMGDSAGAGMALALCQLLNEKAIQQPASLFLLSPWLDVTMSNPDIKALDPLDPILNLQGLIDSGKAYAGDMDRRHYLVSPLYGSMEGLPSVHVIVGTHDVMLADSRKFKLKAENEELDLDYHEIEGLLHDGMLYPTPEGKACRELIFSTLKNEGV